ncbi:MAG: dihydroorotase [Clostridiales bacterium]|nr:dihydroorotase [Clostridiales bacterium]
MQSTLIWKTQILDPASGLDRTGNILIENGRIVSLSAETIPQKAQVIDGEGLVAVPGLVDMHVHLRDPGFTHKEDIFTACEAAAAGGVTAVAAMPNTRPTADCGEIIEDILSRSQNAKARVFQLGSITKGLKSEQLCDFEELKRAGAVAVSDDGRPVLTATMLLDGMRKANNAELPVICHCEDLSLATGGIINEGEVSKELGVRGIPRAAEDAAVAREIALAAAHSLPVHIAHVSTKGSVALIRDAKRRGVAVTCETAPHYFALTEQCLLGRDANYRMNPPLGTEEDRLAVIEGLMDGTIDAIATDHAPHSASEKADFETAPNGVVGLETSLAAGITYLVKPEILPLKRLIELMSASPADILHIDAGRLELGKRADICLFDPDEQWTVVPEKLHSRSKNTPFAQIRLTGRVRYTMLQGEVVYKAE